MEMKEEEKKQEGKLFIQFKQTTEHPGRMAKNQHDEKK